VERAGDGKRLALKMLMHAESGSWLARLAREAQAATAIAHPNVVTILDIDIDASGLPFVVMELVKGGPLTAQQSRFGDPAFARDVIRQIAAGLEAMHEAGIVHRDLKPTNVLLEPRHDQSFQVKIVDFGIARVATQPAPSVLGTDGFIPFVRGEDSATHGMALTRSGWIFGTPLYMAPELANGVKDAPPSCDLWSLGVVAYQLACGKLPFLEPPVVVMEREARLPAPPDLQLLAPPLRAIVERCLDFDPRRRPTAAEVAAALA
jgi:serine/threonine-protein kinase